MTNCDEKKIVRLKSNTRLILVAVESCHQTFKIWRQ